ncbi:hypothetical protein [Streptomyces sp. NPDC055632]
MNQNNGEEYKVSELIDALARQGLDEEADIPGEAPAPKKASLAVSGGNVQPTVTVPHKVPNARDRVDSLWHEEADRLRIFNERREFLLLATYPGSLTRGWIRMRDSIGTHLPSRIAAATGHRGFIAVSLDGTSLCAVSVEEYEDWIVTHSFQDARKKNADTTPGDS